MTEIKHGSFKGIFLLELLQAQDMFLLKNRTQHLICSAIPDVRHEGDCWATCLLCIKNLCGG